MNLYHNRVFIISNRFNGVWIEVHATALSVDIQCVLFMDCN